jgi:hypothetical protein
MSKEHTQVQEIMNSILNALYNNRDFQVRNFDSLFEGSQISNARYIDLIKQKLKDSGFIESGDDVYFDLWTNIQLSDFRIEMIEEHGSYLNYQSFKQQQWEEEKEAEKKREREERLKDWPKRNWAWVAVASFIFAGVLSPIIVEYYKANYLGKSNNSDSTNLQKQDATKKSIAPFKSK